MNPRGGLVYSTYLGGSKLDKGTAIAVDGSGNAYVIGVTQSSNFPTLNPLQPNLGGGICGSDTCSDAFVSKLNPQGSALVYSTYLGGNAADIGQGIAVDHSGNAYVTGSTQSTNFPTQNPLQASISSASASDAFVTEINSTGSGLVYSTYLGGSNADAGQGIAVDGSGSAYVTGYTSSTNFPLASPFQSASRGNEDAFVAKLNASGTGLAYSTYLGGSGNDRGFAIAVDGSGNAYVTGDSASTDLPATPGAFQSTNNASGLNTGAFVAKFSVTGTETYFTFLGGSAGDSGNGPTGASFG